VPTLLTEVGHLDTKSTGYLVSAGGALGALGMLFTGWLSDRRGERFSFLLYGTLSVGACFLVLAFTTSPTVIIVTYLVFAGTWTSVTLATWLVSTDIIHHRLLAVGSAAINTIAQIGGFVGPSLWGVAREATGSYQMGLIVLTVIILAAAAVIINLRRQVMGAPHRKAIEAAEIEG
jgi:ACS family tartrate transporter-like MFS transporter